MMDKDNEGFVEIDAVKCVVTVKVQGPNPVGLRGLLWECLVLAVREFSSVEIEQEELVCACGQTLSANYVRKSFTRGNFRVKCVCEELLPTDDLLPGALSLATEDPTAASKDYELMLQLLAFAEKTKKSGKFGFGTQREWRRLVTVYLFSFVKKAAFPNRDRAPPLLWLPRPSTSP